MDQKNKNLVVGIAALVVLGFVGLKILPFVISLVGNLLSIAVYLFILAAIGYGAYKLLYKAGSSSKSASSEK